MRVLEVLTILEGGANSFHPIKKRGYKKFNPVCFLFFWWWGGGGGAKTFGPVIDQS